MSLIMVFLQSLPYKTEGFQTAVYKEETFQTPVLATGLNGLISIPGV